MKFEEALKLMREGKKIRNKNWFINEYLYNNKNVLYFHSKSYDEDTIANDYINPNDIFTDDWEEYKTPSHSILTRQECDYLNELLEPVKDRVAYIRLIDGRYDNSECIHVDILCAVLELPWFKKGAKYKNMEVNRCYTPEELGLFENN